MASESAKEKKNPVSHEGLCSFSRLNPFQLTNDGQRLFNRFHVTEKIFDFDCLVYGYQETALFLESLVLPFKHVTSLQSRPVSFVGFSDICQKTKGELLLALNRLVRTCERGRQTVKKEDKERRL